MPGQSKQTKRELPAKARREMEAEHRRVQAALLDTFERLWSERPKEKGNTQAATMVKAGLTPQTWGKWGRGSDMTLSSAVAVAYALDRRIGFELESLSDPSDTVTVVTNQEGEPLTDDVLALAQELDGLPEEERRETIAGIRGLMSGLRIARPPSPSGPAADHRGHRGRKDR